MIHVPLTDLTVNMGFNCQVCGRRLWYCSTWQTPSYVQFSDVKCECGAVYGIKVDAQPRLTQLRQRCEVCESRATTWVCDLTEVCPVEDDNGIMRPHMMYDTSHYYCIAHDRRPKIRLLNGQVVDLEEYASAT